MLWHTYRRGKIPRLAPFHPSSTRPVDMERYGYEIGMRAPNHL